MFDIKAFNKVLDIYFVKSSHSDLAKSSVIFAVWVSLCLVALKIVAWVITGSISMQASLNDSCLDALASFVAYHALKFSAVKYDVKHNFGHEKVEGIVAIFQCMIVIYSGFIICRDAYEVFLHPKPITHTGVGVVVMLISCLAVYQLIYFQRYVAGKTSSIIVKGDSLHYLSDFFMNICVIFSLLLSGHLMYVDVVCGLTVGIYVLYNAFLIMKNALNDLMDEALPADIQKIIIDAIISVKGIEKITIFRARSAGMKKYVEVRVTVDRNITFIEADKITNNAETVVKNLFDNVDVIIKAEIEA